MGDTISALEKGEQDSTNQKMSSSIDSISKRQQHYSQAFSQHQPTIQALHHQAINQLLPQLTQALELTPLSAQLITNFLNDKLNLFRFLNRNHFDSQLTLQALSTSIKWRLTANIDLLSLNSLEPIYLSNPLLFFHPQLKDRWGRTSAILNLRYLTRTEDGSLDGLKEFIAWNCELARRSMYESNPELINQICSSSSPPSSPNQIPFSLQISLIVDLKGASINNLEVELLPYLLHLVKDNFPDMLGAVFILNYGWMYAGMWQVVKRILSQSTLDRILFPSQSELLQFFEKSNLLKEHGGLVVHQYDPKHDPFISRFGKPIPNTLADLDSRPSLSRHPSLESIHDIFFSTVNTPHHQLSNPNTPNRAGTFNHSHRRPSWLNMTSYHPSQLSSSAISDALQRNQSKSSSSNHPWLHQSSSNPSFKLKLPIKTRPDQHGETGDSSVLPPLLTSGHSLTSSSSSSSSSLSETGREIDQQEDENENDEKNDEGRNRNRDRIERSNSTPIVKFKKRKRDYFCIKLLIKFGYFLRTLQMLLKLLSSKLFVPLHLSNQYPDRQSGHHRSSSHQGSLLPTVEEDRFNEGEGGGQVSESTRPVPIRHRFFFCLPNQLSLNQLFLLLNFQRKKFLGSFGCLLLFLLFFKKKKL
ncbi:hypothetical protein PGTUg99_032378 [Puccinia graminis f. sp. tritici]|uniref:CRAL-TRIO domain-containing protein n=1 Tax=Puccinia graminis f. sp. tritici TaxID=56615 RepID=A0A5B0S8Z0_PUCGR|nr:hypothetical protein PGTUg99_032378 [Puccinia graminis f. sp. tritici]